MLNVKVWLSFIFSRKDATYLRTILYVKIQIIGSVSKLFDSLQILERGEIKNKQYVQVYHLPDLLNTTGLLTQWEAETDVQ